MAGLGIGMLSTAENGKHTPSFDFDEITEAEAMKRATAISERHNFADGLLVRTKNGFHAIFPYDSVSLRAYRRILDETLCDPAFKAITSLLRASNIRVAGKWADEKREVLTIQGKRTPTAYEKSVGDGLIAFFRALGTIKPAGLVME